VYHVASQIKPDSNYPFVVTVVCERAPTSNPPTFGTFDSKCTENGMNLQYFYLSFHLRLTKISEQYKLVLHHCQVHWRLYKHYLLLWQLM